MERLRCDVAVVGAGFAGAITARVLRRLGYRVAVLERGRHPRFALGESSTPLAAIALERLAARFGLDDLHALASYGRWCAHLPELGRGLKRGFTFYGRERKGARSMFRRLLVAASPSDEVADAHWLRADVDAFLVERAITEGVMYRDQVELTTLEPGPPSRLRGSREGGRFEVETSFVIDGSGGAGFLATALPIRSTPERISVTTALVYGHFTGVVDSAAVAATEIPDLPPGPYPDHRAAVHHLLEGGWAYVLPFDHGVASVGVLLAVNHPAARELLSTAAGDAERLWALALARYPILDAQLAGAKPRFPPRFVPHLPHRLERAAGERWLLLPSTYAFADPLFSTGIAWSLLGVERIASLFAEGLPGAAALERYALLLEREATHLDQLIRGAYLALVDFRLFAPTSMLYFAAASFAEAMQRLRPAARAWEWEGFLGATDEAANERLREACRRLETLAQAAAGPLAEPACEGFAQWVARAIEPTNIAGLADPARGDLYPVDFEPLITGAAKLEMTEEEVRAALPQLLR